MKKTKKQRILHSLWDGKALSNRQLSQISLRFGGLIHELREAGIKIETIESKQALESAGFNTDIFRPADGFVAYRLITPTDRIDYHKCCLLERQQSELF